MLFDKIAGRQFWVRGASPPSGLSVSEDNVFIRASRQADILPIRLALNS
jgi:hypothetical protein